MDTTRFRVAVQDGIRDPLERELMSDIWRGHVLVRATNMRYGLSDVPLHQQWYGETKDKIRDNEWLLDSIAKRLEAGLEELGYQRGMWDDYNFTGKFRVTMPSLTSRDIWIDEKSDWGKVAGVLERELDFVKELQDMNQKDWDTYYDQSVSGRKSSKKNRDVGKRKLRSFN